LAEARAKAESEGVRFVDGVEISVTWEGTTVHIVGLQIDPEDPVLRSGLESIREGRATRAEKMGEALAAAGVPDSLAGAKTYAENPSLISRSHFARHLVKTCLAREFGFTASRGSDYHGKGESRADLGALPQLPDDLKPVWHDWWGAGGGQTALIKYGDLPWNSTLSRPSRSAASRASSSAVCA